MVEVSEDSSQPWFFSRWRNMHGIMPQPKKYEFPQYAGHDGHFALKDIFDMTAGTSTGSILAAGLAYPDVKNTKLENQNINKNYKPDEIFIKPGFFA